MGRVSEVAAKMVGMTKRVEQELQVFPAMDPELVAALHAGNEPEVATEDSAEWDGSEVSFPGSKDQITIRLDSDMVQWFRGQGRGYQTRINAVLRAYYESHKPRN